MTAQRILRTCFFGLILFAAAFGASPAFACVVCGSEGECFEQPSTLSGNCQCVIGQRFGILNCRPKGVCDQNDVNSCSGDPDSDFPVPLTAQGTKILPHFMKAAGSKDPLLGAALWGAVEEDEDAAGRIVGTRIIPGEHTGTMGTPDHRSYVYQVNVQQLAADLFKVQVTLEEEGTGRVRQYDGAIYQNGARGEFARIDTGRPKPIVIWNLNRQ